ncbi:tyrosine-type recombinase/integrase [Bilophila wadsworthia]|uniref:tyrosine-type recombinase/integrase n=1 Tax=Bilophila wadsworthia TaxID=35833 RepID=UPI003AB4738B
MSWSQRSDGRFIVKYKDKGLWKQISFTDKEKAIHFDAMHNAPKEEIRLTMGELIVKYLHGNPDLFHETRERIIWLYADGGPCAFMRDKYADSLNRQDLEQLRENIRGRKASNNTSNHYQAYTRAILAWGVDQGLLVLNPWRDFKKLKISKPIHTATLLDLKRLYPFLPPYLQWAAKTAFFLALRPGMVELFSLKWDAFDFRRGIVSIRQGKTGKIKSVYPNPVYMQEAAARCAEDFKRGVALVCHNNGKPVLSYHKMWGKACRQAGVNLRFYDVRHLAATEMLARGADLAAVAAQLGHASVTTTGSTYAHVTPGGQSHAGSLMPAIDIEPNS